MMRQYEVPRRSNAETTHSAKMIETTHSAKMIDTRETPHTAKRETPHTAKTSLIKTSLIKTSLIKSSLIKSRTTLAKHRKDKIMTLAKHRKDKIKTLAKIMTLTMRLTTDTKHCNPRMKMKIKMSMP